MGAKTKIQWADATWNPTRGCSMAKGSETGGCLNCYAAQYETRGLQLDSKGNKFAILRDSGPRFTGVVELRKERLTVPLHWRRAKRIFVNSLSDLFHEALPDAARDQVFGVILACQVLEGRERHTFQILTKRSKGMREYFTARTPAQLLEAWSRAAGLKSHARDARGRKSNGSDYIDKLWPLPGVHLAVSVENQPTADARIPDLLQTPAAVRLVSYEPALGPVNFRRLYGGVSLGGASDVCIDALAGKYTAAWKGRDSVPDLPISERGAGRLNQIIIGGESGPRARPFEIDWARDTIRQCKETGVGAFMKQVGKLPVERGFLWKYFPKLTDKKGGLMEEWPLELQVRQAPC